MPKSMSRIPPSSSTMHVARGDVAMDDPRLAMRVVERAANLDADVGSFGG